MYAHLKFSSNTAPVSTGTSGRTVAGQQPVDYGQEEELKLFRFQLPKLTPEERKKKRQEERKLKAEAQKTGIQKKYIRPRVSKSKAAIANRKAFFLSIQKMLNEYPEDPSNASLPVAGHAAQNVPATVQAQRSQAQDTNAHEQDQRIEMNEEEQENVEECIEKAFTCEQEAEADEEKGAEAMDVQLHPCDNAEDAAAPSTSSSSSAKTGLEEVPAMNVRNEDKESLPSASSDSAPPADARKGVVRCTKRKLCTKRGGNKKRKVNSDMTDEDFIKTYEFITKEQKFGALHMQSEYFFKDEMPSEGSKADFEKTLTFDTPVGPKEYRKVESNVFRVNGVDEIEVFDGTWSDANVADSSFVYMKENEYNMSESWDDEFKLCCSCQGECKLKSCECLQMSMKHGRALISGNMICTERNRDQWNLLIFACGPSCHCKGNCENAVPKDATHPDLELVRHNDMIGYGIRAKKNLLPGRLIFEFVGQVTDADPSTIRRDYAWQIYDAEKYEDPLEDDYLKTALCSVLDKEKIDFPERNIYIDPCQKGNIGRYASTSHLPNCQPIRVFEGDLRAEKARLFFYVTLPIEAGQEVVADYGKGYELGGDCLCGKPLCGKAGAFFRNQCKQKNKNGNILSLRKLAATELDVVISEHLEKIWENSDALEESGLTMEELKAFVTKYVAVNRPLKTVNPNIITWLNE